MGVEIAISIAREETRVAVLDNGVVTDLYGDRAKDQDFVGNIYKGRVAKVLPGMQAAFIDIGLEKAAFMHVSDLSTDVEPGDTLVEGDDDDNKDSEVPKPKRPFNGFSQLSMVSRIGAVQPAAHDPNRPPFPGQGAAMRGGIDSPRQATDNRKSHFRQLSRQFFSQNPSGGADFPRSDNRHSIPVSFQ